MPRKSRRRFWVWTVVTAFIITTAAVPIAQLTLPSIYRWHNLRKLVSDDPATRAEGHAYLIRRAPEDEKVLQGAIEKLSVESEQIFYEIVLALDQAGLWTVDRIPREHWIRFLARMASDPDAEARLLAGQMLADLPATGDDTAVIKVMMKLTGDEVPVVRFNAMICAAERRGALLAQEQDALAQVYVKMIAERTGDESPMIARHAWMLMGLINDSSNGLSASWHNKDPDVAEAIVWMALHTNPDTPQPAIAALKDATVSPQVRAMAAWMLGRSGTPEARDALAAVLEIKPGDITPANQILFWRTILAMPLKDDAGAATDRAASDPGYAALLRFLSQFKREDYENVTLRPLILACVFRDRQLLIDAGKANSDIFTIADDPVAWLASLEGVAAAKREGRKPGGRVIVPVAPPQLRLAALRAAETIEPEQLLPLLADESETIRNQACVLAWKRLTREQNAALIRRLMDPPKLNADDLDRIISRLLDEAKQSAAMLAGMTGADPKALDQMWRDFSDRRGIRELIQLAFWMQGQPVPDVKDPVDMATKAMMLDVMPKQTMLLAFLHKGEPLALDTLLTPRGDPRADLLKLLDQDRWWFVLEAYLPEGAPRLNVWGDPDLARFQIELLRDWYVLNRHQRAGASSPR